MSRIPRPSQIRNGFGHLRDLRDGGGPRRLRLARLERPEGRLFPTSEASIEIETRAGEVVRLNPELPVPFPYAWGYRLARRLGLPLASTLDPEDISFEVPVPGWIWPGGGRGSGSK